MVITHTWFSSIFISFKCCNKHTAPLIRFNFSLFVNFLNDVEILLEIFEFLWFLLCFKASTCCSLAFMFAYMYTWICSNVRYTSFLFFTGRNERGFAALHKTVKKFACGWHVHSAPHGIYKKNIRKMKWETRPHFEFATTKCKLQWCYAFNRINVFVNPVIWVYMRCVNRNKYDENNEVAKYLKYDFFSLFSK